MSYDSAVKLAELNNLKEYKNNSYRILDNHDALLNIIKKIKFKGDLKNEQRNVK